MLGSIVTQPLRSGGAECLPRVFAGLTRPRPSAGAAAPDSDPREAFRSDAPPLQNLRAEEKLAAEGFEAENDDYCNNCAERE